MEYLRQPAFIFHQIRNGQSPVYRRGDGQADDVIIGPAQHKLGQYADAQTCLDHCHDGVIIMERIFDTGFQPLDFICLFLHGAVLYDAALNKWIEFSAFNGQPDAGTGTGQQLDSQFIFKGTDHLADGRLGITKRFSRFCKTSKLYYFLECKIPVHSTNRLSSVGGTLYCRQQGDRIKLAGNAVLYSEAELLIGNLLGWNQG